MLDHLGIAGIANLIIKLRNVLRSLYLFLCFFYSFFLAFINLAMCRNRIGPSMDLRKLPIQQVSPYLNICFIVDVVIATLYTTTTALRTALLGYPQRQINVSCFFFFFVGGNWVLEFSSPRHVTLTQARYIRLSCYFP